MNEQELENYIAKTFRDLPKKPVVFADRELLWQKIALRIRKIDQKESLWSVSRFLFWPRAVVRVTATVLIVVMALFIAGGVVRAQPGETLYQVKIAAEQVEKVLATNDEAKVKVGIRQAKRRLAEVKILVEEKKDPKIVEETLAALKDTTEEVVEVVSIAELKPELTSQAVELNDEVQTALSNFTGDGVKGAVTVSEEKAIGSDSALATPSSTAKTVSKTPARQKVKKNPAVKDGPVDAGIQIGDVVKVDENDEPVKETDNQ